MRDKSELVQDGSRRSRAGRHLSALGQWAVVGADLDVASNLQSVAELLELFDKNVESAKNAISAVTDEDVMVEWSLLQGGQPLFTFPRAVVIRTFVINHIIHHRAHLCVYLRLNGVAVPGMYGPSGDEQS